MEVYLTVAAAVKFWALILVSFCVEVESPRGKEKPVTVKKGTVQYSEWYVVTCCHATVDLTAADS